MMWGQGKNVFFVSVRGDLAAEIKDPAHPRLITLIVRASRIRDAA
jgi:hypothetical protein